MINRERYNLTPGPEITQLWGDPSGLSPEERQAYGEFLTAWYKTDAEYEAYQHNWSTDRSIDSVQALATCTTAGTNTQVGHHMSVRVSGSTNDGMWDMHNFDSTQTAFGGYIVIYAAPPIGLPEHEESDPAEPMLTAQHLGGHALNAFYRFLNVAVPNGATINYATLRFVASDQDAGSDSTITLTVAGEAVASSTSPVNSLTDATTRTRTTNQRTWVDTLVLDAGGIDTTFDSTNIACVIQELVDQTGWVSGNNIQLFVAGNSNDTRYHVPYDYLEDATKATELHVWYSVAVDETTSGGVSAGGTASTSVIVPLKEVGSGGVKTNGTAINYVPLLLDEWYLSEAIDNTGLARASYNVDRFLFMDVQLTANSDGFAANDRIDLYMICEKLAQDGTSYEDGNETTVPPAANYLGSFVFSGLSSTTEVHILRQISMPPLMFKFLLVNKTSSFINEFALYIRPYLLYQNP